MAETKEVNDIELEDWHLEFMEHGLVEHALSMCPTLAQAQHELEELNQPNVFAKTIEKIKKRGELLAEIVTVHRKGAAFFDKDGLDQQIGKLQDISVFVKAMRKKLDADE